MKNKNYGINQPQIARWDLEKDRSFMKITCNTEAKLHVAYTSKDMTDTAT